MASFRKDIENFEYRKDYYAPEHKWCGLYTLENTRKFYEEKEKIYRKRAERGRVQSNPETTGQHGTMIQ